MAALGPNNMILTAGDFGFVLAGAMKLGQALKGKKLAVVVSGANITLEQLMDSIKLYQGISGQAQPPA